MGEKTKFEVRNSEMLSLCLLVSLYLSLSLFLVHMNASFQKKP